MGGLFFPLDEELQLLPGEFTPLLHERLVEVGVTAKSFLAGGRVFFSFTRTPVSEPTVRRYTERMGAVMEACEEEGTGSPASQPAADERPRWVGVDGVFVRLVGGGWREVRTVTLGVVETKTTAGGEPGIKTQELSYFSRLTEGAETFIDLAEVEFRRRGLAEATRVGAGADGADWCQQLFDRHCPTALRVLDFYHAAERIQAFSKAVCGSGALNTWYAQHQLHRLKHEGPAPLLASLTAWSQAARGAAQKAAHEQLGFFSKRRALLDYPGIRAAGLPIGTGNAESANLHVIQDRLKGPGKFWEKEHINPMLAARGAWFSHQRWAETWATASTRLATGHYPVSSVHVPRAKT